MRRFFAAMIYGYQLAARAVLPRACRFAPSCSDYARQAVELHGLKGAFLALRRISRCHPLRPGGWDPVPLKQ